MPGLMAMSSAVASMLEAKLYCFSYIQNDLASLAKDHGVVLVCLADSAVQSTQLVMMHLRSYVSLYFMHM